MARLGHRLSLLWLLLILGCCLAGPLITSPRAPYLPVGDPLSAPGPAHLLGTDALGRDHLSRLLFGGRVSLGASLLAVSITVLAGTTIALAASLAPAWIDKVMMWLMNIMLAVPGLLLAMLLVAGWGPSLRAVIFAVGIGGTPGFARLARTIFVQLRQTDYMAASEALGAHWPWKTSQHLLPNAQPQLLALGTIHYAWALLGTTTLTFLGLAGDPSLPEWGSMLNASRIHLAEAPWLAFFPGILISLTILAVHRLGRQLGKPARAAGR